MFSWTLRIAGWTLGIYALLKLAAAAGAVSYTEVFQAWLDELRGLLDLGFLLNPIKQTIILPVLDHLRSLGFEVSPLQDYWQSVFVLTWLIPASAARRVSFGLPSPFALSLAFVLTLTLSVAAGTMSLPHSVMLPITVMGALVAYIAGMDEGKTFLWFVFLPLAVVGFLALIFENLESNPFWLFSLASVTGSLGIASLLISRKNADGRVSRPLVSVGFDTTAVMLGAFGLATAFADPPIF